MPFIDTTEYVSQFDVLTVYSSSGKVGIIRIHKNCQKSSYEYKLNCWIAFDKAKVGCVVDILPTLFPKDPNRNIIFPDAKHFKNPDLRIDGVLCEVESPEKPKKMNNLKHRISEGAQQANWLIIDLSESIDINLMRRVSKSKFIDCLDLQIIEFRYKETFFPFFRGSFNFDKKEPPI